MGTGQLSSLKNEHRTIVFTKIWLLEDCLQEHWYYCLHFKRNNSGLDWRQFSSGVKTIVQCFSFLWRQLSGAHYFAKTIFQCSYFLHFYHFLMKTIRQCFISCEDNCTSARVDNFTSVDNFTIPRTVTKKNIVFWP